MSLDYPDRDKWLSIRYTDSRPYLGWRRIDHAPRERPKMTKGERRKLVAAKHLALWNAYLAQLPGKYLTYAQWLHEPRT